KLCGELLHCRVLEHSHKHGDDCDGGAGTVLCHEERPREADRSHVLCSARGRPRLDGVPRNPKVHDPAAGRAADVVSVRNWVLRG
ncbi:hypothetical protein IWQ56_006501, partial [Coemansia nantahalensis]